MMISFYRKITPHSFLGLTSPTTTTTSLDTAAPHDQKLPSKCHSPLTTASPAAGGGGLLGLFTPPNIIKRQTLVLESSSVKSSSAFTSSASSSDSSPPPSSSPPTGVYETKKDYPAGFGFIDEIGGGVDGLMSCTESLGFESSDERLVDDHHQHHVIERFSYDEDHDVVEEKEDDAYLRLMKQPIKRPPSTVKKMAEAKKFPPLLSSLNQNGNPKYYLRPIRKDGRLELTEVRIYRPEILRAYREDGRLRLHLITQHDQPLQEEEELEAIEELQEEEIVEEENETRVKETDEEKEEENVGGGEWKLQVGGEGFRRCQNLVNRHHVHHHHHNSKLAVWNQQRHCVTSR